jgi:peptidoglycan/xylan/chitin deacetylase (PgdA/CDA1 family)
MYHSISDASAPDPHLLRVHPDRMEYQLRWLRRLGLQGVSLAAALDAAQRGEHARLVALTFDDGYADFRHVAMPILEKYDMTATVFVVAGRLDMTNDWDGDAPQVPLMSADDVRAAAAAGHEVGSHGLTHLRLAGATSEQLDAEVASSRAVLEDVLQRSVAGFCFPYGSHDDTCVTAVEAAGYRYACVTNTYGGRGPFRLPRYYVGQQDGALRLAAKEIRHRVKSAL